MSKLTKQIGDLGENLVALCVPKIFGEKSVVVRVGSDNYPFDLLIFPTKENFEKVIAVSVTTRAIGNNKLPSDMPLPKNFSSYKLEFWIAAVIYSISKNTISFGVYFAPLSEILKENFIKEKRKGKHFNVKPYIKYAQKRGYFFESKDLWEHILLHSPESDALI